MKEEADKKSYIDPQKSLEAKERGNEFFKEGKFPESIKEYSEAIKRNPDDHVLYSNRAASYTKLGEYNMAVKDCDISIKLNPKFGKYRKFQKNSVLFFIIFLEFSSVFYINLLFL